MNKNIRNTYLLAIFTTTLLAGCASIPTNLILSLKDKGEKFISNNGFTQAPEGKHISVGWMEGLAYCSDENCTQFDYGNLLVNRHDTIKPSAVGYYYYPNETPEEATLGLLFEPKDPATSGYKCISINITSFEIHMPHSYCHGRGMKKFPSPKKETPK